MQLMPFDFQYRLGDYRMKKTALLMVIVTVLTALLLTACASKMENSPSASDITAEEAKTIALEHAGVTAEQVKGLRVEYEIDDGIAEYEVQFRVDRLEYDYTLRAENGEILSFDMDD